MNREDESAQLLQQTSSFYSEECFICFLHGVKLNAFSAVTNWEGFFPEYNYGEIGQNVLESGKRY